MTESKPIPIEALSKDSLIRPIAGRQGMNRMKRLLMGVVFAIAGLFLNQNASAGNQLSVVFRTAMVSTGVDQNARGNLYGVLIRNGFVSSQYLNLSINHLDTNTTYQLMAFIGDETTRRSVAEFTTDAKGAFVITYIQRCPGNSSKGGKPLPMVLDPISHIHQLDIVKDGNLILSGLIGSDLQADCTAPTVSYTVPANDATDVPVNQAIAATFSEPMNPATINRSTFLLKRGTVPVAGTVTYAGTTATLTPTSALASNTLYTATITKGAKDVAGNWVVTNFVWSFRTGPALDTTAPTVISTVPFNSATGVPVSQTLAVTFSEAMNHSTITSSTFTLTGPGATPVTGIVAYDVISHIATFAPSSALASNTFYTGTISTGSKDLAGNSLASDVVWNFTTATTTTAGQTTVVLGTSANFAVLAGSTVTSSGATTVNGDLGVSAGTAVTGFPPGLVNGAIHAGDSAAAQAQLDLTIAYNDAAGRTVFPVALAGNLGGMTLTPGLYKSTSSLEISSGDLTLDAQGNANAVFIFQIASTLTTTSGRQVILSGGAKAANVFWQVGSSATLGTTSVFKGIIMADQSITLTTGATLEGRALARIAAVTMDANVVTIPIP